MKKTSVEVILLENVEHVGPVGSMVKVAAGYLRNYLLPNKFAVPASIKQKKRLEHERRLAQFRHTKVQEAATATRNRLESLSLRITRRVGEQGKMFGSVTAQDVQEALAKAGVQVDRRKVLLAEPIKVLGAHSIGVRLGDASQSAVNVTVVAEA